MMNGLDLFSGIGGIALALAPWVRTLCYVEMDWHSQALLMSRMQGDERADDPEYPRGDERGGEGSGAGAGDTLTQCAAWNDVRTFDPGPWAGSVDIITGGFPCQDISTAGRGAGLAGQRSVLFWEIIRCARVIRPGFIFLENVPAITGRGGREVAGALAALGFDARWGVLSAFDVGAPHLRERWWCLAHDQDDGRRQGRAGGLDSGRAGERERALQAVAGATGARCAGRLGEPGGPVRNGTRGAEPGRRGSSTDATLHERGREPQRESGSAVPPGIGAGGAAAVSDGLAANRIAEPWSECGYWAVEPGVGRVADGVPFRVDRLKGLGNAVAPLCACEAFRRLSGL